MNLFTPIVIRTVKTVTHTTIRHTSWSGIAISRCPLNGRKSGNARSTRVIRTEAKALKERSITHMTAITLYIISIIVPPHKYRYG